MDSGYISGVDDVVKMFSDLPVYLSGTAQTRALAAAGDVLETEVWRRTPIDLKAAQNKAHSGLGPLAGKLDRWVEVDSGLRGGQVSVGFGQLGHIALWVEYGHRMVGRRSEGMTWRDFRKGNVNRLGDVRAHPFMRPAVIEAGERAIDAYVASVRSTLFGDIGSAAAAA